MNKLDRLGKITVFDLSLTNPGSSCVGFTINNIVFYSGWHSNGKFTFPIPFQYCIIVLTEYDGKMRKTNENFININSDTSFDGSNNSCGYFLAIGW